MAFGLRTTIDSILDVGFRLSYVSSVPDAGKKSAAGPPEAEMPFEEAVKKLENIVEAMESGDLPLETLLQRFEDGTRLYTMTVDLRTG